MSSRGRIPSTVLTAPFLSIVCLVACDGAHDPVAPEPELPVPTHLRLDSSPLRLVVPAETDLEVAVLDQSGREMAGQPVTFISRDTTTVEVSAHGRVTAVSSGEAWVVVSSGALRDSIAVEVRYHVVDGTAVMRVRGQRDVVQAQEAWGAHLQFMRTHDRDRLVLTFENHGWPDTALVVVLPDVSPGSVRLRPGSAQSFVESPSLLEVPTYEAYLVAEGNGARVYAGLEGGRLDIETVTEAGGWGLSGVLRGRMRFRAIGSEVVDGLAGATPTTRSLGDTIDVVLDFAAEYLSWAVGQATYTITGGPFPMTDRTVEAWWVGDAWSTVLQIEDGPPDMSLELPWPEVGTFPIDSIGYAWTPEEQPERTLRAYGPSPYASVGIGGSITFTRVTPPEGDAWGIVSGTASVLLACYDRGTYPPAFADTARLELAFDAIVTTGNGPSSVAPRAVGGKPLRGPEAP